MFCCYSQNGSLVLSLNFSLVCSFKIVSNCSLVATFCNSLNSILSSKRICFSNSSSINLRGFKISSVALKSRTSLLCEEMAFFANSFSLLRMGKMCFPLLQNEKSNGFCKTNRHTVLFFRAQFLLKTPSVFSNKEVGRDDVHGLLLVRPYRLYWCDFHSLYVF